MTTKAYKIITNGINGNRSLIQNLHQWVLTYTPNQWTEAKDNSGIFVFDTWEHCMQSGIPLLPDFGCTVQVWECECEDPMEFPFSKNRVLSKIRHHTTESIADYWKGVVDNPNQLTSAPEGSRLYKRIKLTKQLDPPPTRF